MTEFASGEQGSIFDSDVLIVVDRSITMTNAVAVGALES